MRLGAGPGQSPPARQPRDVGSQRAPSRRVPARLPRLGAPRRGVGDGRGRAEERSRPRQCRAAPGRTRGNPIDGLARRRHAAELPGLGRRPSGRRPRPRRGARRARRHEPAGGGTPPHGRVRAGPGVAVGRGPRRGEYGGAGGRRVRRAGREGHGHGARGRVRGCRRRQSGSCRPRALQRDGAGTGHRRGRRRRRPAAAAAGRDVRACARRRALFRPRRAPPPSGRALAGAARRRRRAGRAAARAADRGGRTGADGRPARLQRVHPHPR